MTSRLRGLAVRAPVPVYAIAGCGMRDRVQDLRLLEGLDLVDTPRAATVLLVAGAIGRQHAEALARVHDAMPHPRATLLWGADDGTFAPPTATVVDRMQQPAPALRARFAAMVTGSQATEASVLADTDPAPWRGVGPYGQGGSGMTGGTPYGRPMAELGPDRDGLRLDVLPVQLGPFLTHLPAGLVLDVRVAGDVIVEATVTSAALDVERGPSDGSLESPFVRALTEPVPIVELELARARSHLRWIADALRTQGLSALGVRALRLAHEVRPGEGDRVRQLARRIARTGLYRWSLAPVAGKLLPEHVALMLGPVSRAAGLREDVRLEDPAYRQLGFEPISLDTDNVAARWRVRLEEAAAALDVAGRAGDRRTGLLGRVESPRGRLAPGDSPTERVLGILPGLLEGLEWSDAMSTIASLDLDLDEIRLASAPGPGRAA